METNIYKSALKEFYGSVLSFVTSDSRLTEELNQKSICFRFLTMGDREKIQFNLDWFIFDVKVDLIGKTIIEHWLEKGDLDNAKRALYGPFLRGVFGLFEIMAIRIGKEMVIRDLIDNKEYQVQDDVLTKTATKGACAFARVLPYRDDFILTGLPDQVPTTPSGTC